MQSNATENIHHTEIDITRALPPEILSRIFVFCARDAGYNGYNFLPFIEWFVPVQIVISHVCSTWRQLALGTTELWTNVYIDGPFEENDLYQTWLSRAGSRPLRLGLKLDNDDVIDMDGRVVETFWKIVNKAKNIKELELEIYVKHLSQLKESVENKLPFLERLHLTLDGNGSAPVPLDMPDFVIHTRNVTFSSNHLHDGVLLHELHLPWDRLKSLNVTKSVPLSDCMVILKQTSSLEICRLTINHANVEYQGAMVTLPSVYTVAFRGLKDPINRIISHFEFPNLKSLSIRSASEWTNDTYGTIKNRYNLHRLQELKISRSNLPKSIPTSIILKDAPLLTCAGIPGIDDETINGISTGDLGRSLNSLTLTCTDAQIDIVLEMVRKRSKLAAQGFGRDHPRRRHEELPRLISEVYIFCGIRRAKQLDIMETLYGQRLAVLQHMGVKARLI